MPFCTNCGVNNPDHVQFCTNCGAGMPEAPRPAAAAAAPVSVPYPGYAYPAPAPQPKKNNLALIIGIVAALLVIGIVVGVLFLTGVLGGGSGNAGGTGSTAILTPSPAPTPSPTPAPSVVGTWSISKMSYQGVEIDVSQNPEYANQILFVFEEGGTGTAYMQGDTDSFTWTDQTLTMDGEAVTYTLEGDVLTLSSEDGYVMVFHRTTGDVVIPTPAPAPYSAGRAGTYYLSGMVQDGEDYAEYIDLISDMFQLVLWDDGTGYLQSDDETYSLTWTDSIICLEGEDLYYTYDAGTCTITIMDGLDSMSFTKR